MAVESAYEFGWKYSLATAKMLNSVKAADQAGSKADRATAMNTFSETMKGMIPDAAQSSPQFQYFTALDTLNNALYAAGSNTEKQSAMDAFYSSLDSITVTG